VDRIREPVEEDLHLAAHVVDVHGRTEHDRIRIFHPGHEARNIVVVNTDAVDGTGIARGAGHNAEIGEVDDLGLRTGFCCSCKYKGRKFPRAALHCPGTSVDGKDLHNSPDGAGEDMRLEEPFRRFFGNLHMP
jgi:hypothetical protein